jgi:hypothetical protein
MEFKEHQGSEVLFICVAVILKLHVDQWIWQFRHDPKTILGEYNLFDQSI